MSPVRISRSSLILILTLVGLFAIFLVVYAGRVGLKALLSFAVSILVIWKLFIPATLRFRVKRSSRAVW